MYFIFTCFAFLNSLFGVLDAEGWALVAKPKERAFTRSLEEERDPSIWVVFAKQLGDEKFLVRFPEDPLYTYLTSDEMEISCSRGDISYLLRVLRNPGSSFFDERKKVVELHPETLLIQERRPSPHILELFYRNEEGKWVWEQLRLSAHHLYFFQTKSDTIQSDLSYQFVNSLELEIVQ